MPYSIELRFDPATEEAILGIWKDAALFYGSDHVLKNGVIPHLALVVGDAGLVEVFERIEVSPDSVKLSGTGFFDGGSVAYLPAEVPGSVIAIQRQAHQLAVDAGAVLDPYYHPGNWLPHCTIAMECVENLGETLANFDLPAARIRSIILIQYPPTTLLAERMAD